MMKAGILIGQLSKQNNQSALIRTAEALGVNQVFAVDDHSTKISNTVSRGSHKHVHIRHFDTYENFVESVKQENYNIVSIENTPTAKPVEKEIDYPVNPIFVVGNEGTGIPKDVMRGTDLTVKISQSPNSYIRCLNTTVSGSIVMHDWYSNRWNRDKAQRYEM